MKLIISYPRSGLHWLRYCVRFLNPWENNSNEPPYFPTLETHHAHFAREQYPDQDFEKCVLILRNYKENFARPYAPSSKEQFDPTSRKSPLEQIESYCDNIHIFDTMKVPKHIIYYEDFINDFEIIVNTLKFLGADMSKLPELANNLDYHKRESVKWYEKHRDKSYSNGKTIFHSHALPYKVGMLLDELVEQNLGQLYVKYVGMYKENIVKLL